MYLLDTNICIFLIKKKNATLLENLKKKLNKDLFVSSLTVAELEFGIQKSEFKEKNKVALIEFLTIFNILPFLIKMQSLTVSSERIWRGKVM